MGLLHGRSGRQSSTPDSAQSLERTIHNAGSYLMHVAARLNSMQERLIEAKEAFLARRAVVGKFCLLTVGRLHSGLYDAWPAVARPCGQRVGCCVNDVLRICMARSLEA